MRHSRRGPWPEPVLKNGNMQSSWPQWALSALIQAPVAAPRQLAPLAQTRRHVYVSFPLFAPPQSRSAAAVPSRGSADSAPLAISWADDVACRPSHSVQSGCSPE